MVSGSRRYLGVSPTGPAFPLTDVSRLAATKRSELNIIDGELKRGSSPLELKNVTFPKGIIAFLKVTPKNVSFTWGFSSALKGWELLLWFSLNDLYHFCITLSSTNA